MPATTIKPAAPAAVLPASAQTISRRRLLTAAGSAALLTAGAALTPKPVRAAAVGGIARPENTPYCGTAGH